MSELLKENENGERVREPFVVDNDFKAEWCLNKIRKAKAEQARQKEEYQRQMQFYADQMAIADKEADDEIAFFTAMLKPYFQSRLDAGFTKATKSEINYKLPSGKLVLKQLGPKFEYKDHMQEAIDFCKANKLKKYVKTKEELDWQGLKKVVKVVGNCVALETGEIIPGIEVSEQDDDFRVEVK